jgi:hypothetical protein
MAEVSHLQHEKEQLLVCVRREERRRRDALRELQRANEERDVAQQSLHENQAELQQLKEAYRKHLGSVLEGDNPQTHPRTARSGASGTDNNDLSWQAMAESYIQTETKLLAEAERGNENLRQTTTALRKLYDHYRYRAAPVPVRPLTLPDRRWISLKTIALRPCPQTSSPPSQFSSTNGMPLIRARTTPSSPTPTVTKRLNRLLRSSRRPKRTSFESKSEPQQSSQSTGQSAVHQHTSASLPSLTDLVSG